jgi:hypothetical protein
MSIVPAVYSWPDALSVENIACLRQANQENVTMQKFHSPLTKTLCALWQTGVFGQLR